MMSVVCEHILFCHSDLAFVTRCDAVMQVSDFDIIIVILPLLRHVIVSFHKCRAVGFKLATACSIILGSLRDILRDSHPFCVVALTEKVTPCIVHAGMGVICFLIGLYVDIERGACGCSLHVRKGIDVINTKFIASQ